MGALMQPVATTVPPTVLAVDDNESARTSLVWVLQAHGFRVLEAATGNEALHLARLRPDVVVLDVVLPDRDGFEVCRLLKADPDTAHTPVLMLSGRAVADDDRVHGLDDGADAFLTKPAEPAVLIAHLRALLRVRRAEDAARASEARCRAIIDSSDAAIVSTDPDWMVESWNPAAERLFGYTAAEIIGRPIFALVPPDQRAEAVRVADRVRAGEKVNPYETVRIRKDGRTVPVAVNPWPVRGAAGELLSLAAVYTDLTEKRQLEELFRQSQKLDAVGRLAGGIAHDFNNILTVINGCSELLLGHVPATDPGHVLVEEIFQAGERAAVLTRQLLAFSRKQVLTPKVLDLNAVVRDIGRMLGRLIREDIALAESLQPGLALVRADPGQVGQVILNLAVNARDAMSAGGRLTIETRDAELNEDDTRSYPGARPGRYALLEVSDTGRGMTDEVKARLFEPFFTTKDIGQGTGLGLATVYGIVQAHGGHIRVETEVGRGTTFRVYWPAIAGLPADTDWLAREPGFLGGTEVVLVVEDEEGVRELVRRTLLGFGYTVLVAPDGEQALATARQSEQPIDLLLTDMVMPGLSGRDVADELCAAHPGLSVVYMSGYADDTAFRQGIEQDRVSFLPKPFTPTALAHKIREVLDRR